jgi:hypothetical protein
MNASFFGSVDRGFLTEGIKTRERGTNVNSQLAKFVSVFTSIVYGLILGIQCFDALISSCEQDWGGPRLRRRRRGQGQVPQRLLRQPASKTGGTKNRSSALLTSAAGFLAGGLDQDQDALQAIVPPNVSPFLGFAPPSHHLTSTLAATPGPGPGPGGLGTQGTGTSAKKRWLRQAMSAEADDSSNSAACPSPNSNVVAEQQSPVSGSGERGT